MLSVCLKAEPVLAPGIALVVHLFRLRFAPGEVYRVFLQYVIQHCVTTMIQVDARD